MSERNYSSYLVNEILGLEWLEDLNKIDHLLFMTESSMEIWLFLHYFSCLSKKYNSGFFGQVKMMSSDCHLLQYDPHAEVKACILPM